ncbi:MAG: hypothetical protein ACO1RT_17195 [Planctomycetaceae bacterium]
MSFIPSLSSDQCSFHHRRCARCQRGDRFFPGHETNQTPENSYGSGNSAGSGPRLRQAVRAAADKVIAAALGIARKTVAIGTVSRDLAIFSLSGGQEAIQPHSLDHRRWPLQIDDRSF